RSTLATIQAVILRSPQGILRLGIGVISLMLVLALVTRFVIPALSPAAEVASMTSDAPAVVFSSFESNAPENDWWPQGQTGALAREIKNGFYRFRNERPGIAATSLLTAPGEYYDSI